MPQVDDMDQRTEEQIREALPLYALGLLEADEARTIAEHIDGGCDECARELRGLREVAGEIPYMLRSVKPHARVRDRLLASIAGDAPVPERPKRPKGGLEQPLPGVFVLKQDAGEWRSTPYTGITYKLLYFDKETKYATSLMKMEPGAKYPAHRHAGCEQCLVIEGDARLGSVGVSKGDFEFAVAGTEHGVITTDHGCVLLLIAHHDDEVFA
jgi:anti-sigma factor ChrR (cupin superfamily)